MSRFKVCSSKKVIAQFWRDFRPSNTNFVENAIEWIGDAIDEMRCNTGYAVVWKDIQIINWQGEIPCELESILYVTANGFRLRRNGGLRIKFRCSTSNSVPLGSHTYTLNQPNKLEVSFETGCVRLYYQSLPIDCDGYPMVIDTSKYRNALSWYILMKMCSGGFKHQVFNYQSAKAEWEAAVPKAQNDCKMWDLDQAENFKHNYLGIVSKLNRADEFHRTNGSAFVESAFEPGSLLQTFQIIGKDNE